MNSPHVYDKAKYHFDSIEQHGLSEEHAMNHTVFFLRWLIENDLMSKEFVEESSGLLENFRTGRSTIHDIYESWDCCLIDDMLSDEGNEFAMHYFDFDTGKYLEDYIETLQGDLPSEFHIQYSEENYQRMKQLIDQRYKAWKSSRT